MYLVHLLLFSLQHVERIKYEFLRVFVPFSTRNAAFGSRLLYLECTAIQCSTQQKDTVTRLAAHSDVQKFVNQMYLDVGPQTQIA